MKKLITIALALVMTVTACCFVTSAAQSYEVIDLGGGVTLTVYYDEMPELPTTYSLTDNAWFFEAYIEKYPNTGTIISDVNMNKFNNMMIDFDDRTEASNKLYIAIYDEESGNYIRSTDGKFIPPVSGSISGVTLSGLPYSTYTIEMAALNYAYISSGAVGIY